MALVAHHAPDAETGRSCGIGQRADYHNLLDLAEIAADVTKITCATSEMPIFTDPRIDDRRFAVLTCDTPTITP